MTRNPVSKLLLFGATGDLARRMLLPSLFNLHADGLLPQDLQIIGSARGDLDDKGYQDLAGKALDEFLSDDRRDELRGQRPPGRVEPRAGGGRRRGRAHGAGLRT